MPKYCVKGLTKTVDKLEHAIIDNECFIEFYNIERDRLSLENSQLKHKLATAQMLLDVEINKKERKGDYTVVHKPSEEEVASEIPETFKKGDRVSFINFDYVQEEQGAFLYEATVLAAPSPTSKSHLKVRLIPSGKNALVPADDCFVQPCKDLCEKMDEDDRKLPAK